MFVTSFMKKYTILRSAKIVICQVIVLTHYVNVGRVKRSLCAGGSVLI